jgi:hypothetical protein
MNEAKLYALWPPKSWTGACVVNLVDAAQSLFPTADKLPATRLLFECEHAVVICRAFEKRRQHHHSVGAAINCMARALDQFVNEQRRCLGDDLRASVDHFSAERDDRLRFVG